MVLVRFTTVVPLARAAAFAYAGDFANIAKWDPGVKSSVKSSPGPVAAGTEYDLVTVFKGKESKMKYVVKEYVEGEKLVVYGENDTVTGLDTILFSDVATPGSTQIDYEAELKLKGVLSLFTWFISSDLHNLAIEARKGLEKSVAALPASKK